MKWFNYIAVFSMIISWNLPAQSQPVTAPLETVDYVELGKYAGRWYQIARKPLFFEGDCACSQQTLTPWEDGRIGVYNSCNNATPAGALREISGFAVNLEPGKNAKFLVDFNLPKKGDYWIIGLGDNYEYAIVSDPARSSLYILSKTPMLSDDLKAEALAKAAQQVSVGDLLWTEQQGCVYPAMIKTTNYQLQPQDPNHPGSSVYTNGFQKQDLKIQGRDVRVYLPTDSANKPLQQAPVVVFGHGQGIDADGYHESFVHFAKKGIAVIHPMYDTGFFDRSWRRMADDFNNLTAQTLTKFQNEMNPSQVIYAGHSKGGYIAGMAAGAPSLKNTPIQLKKVILLAPAGFDEAYVKSISPNVTVTLVWSDQDSIIKERAISEIYTKLTVPYKQMITLKSYPDRKADHFYPVSKSYFFGGNDGTNPYHYHSFWKWIVGAADDIKGNKSNTEKYLYGPESLESGSPSLTHTRTKSW